MARFLNLLGAIILLSCLVGCVSLRPAPNLASLQQQETLLTHSLTKLGDRVIVEEAAKVASIAVNYPLQLREQYELVASPILHNMLVNQGLKPRGLCIHWTEDLMRKLVALQLSSLKFYWGVANREATFSLEHSAVIVTPIEKNFEQGLVLDGWRNSGEIFFCPVAEDKYQWNKHFNDITAELMLKNQ